MSCFASKEQDRASTLPCATNPTNQMSKLISAATTGSTEEDFKDVHNNGKDDGLRWIEKYGDAIDSNDDDDDTIV